MECRTDICSIYEKWSSSRCHKKKAYEAMFGCAPRIGLESTNLPQDVFSNLINEQDLENALATLNAEATSNSDNSPEATSSTSDTSYTEVISDSENLFD